MRITVYDQAIDILVQTISVVRNLTNPTNTYLMFCPYCAHEIVQVQGIVSKITPGLEPTADVVVINKCPRCSMRYTIQSQAGSSSQTKVTLTRFKNLESVFRCYICRTPLVSFARDVIILPSMQILHLPGELKCPNSKCGAKYQVVDVV